MTVTDPIPRRKLYQEVLDRLLSRITSGEYAAGDQLPSERQLMEMFQVGRPAIREAMQTLSHMGLVSITHGERARVTPITAAKLIGQVGKRQALPRQRSGEPGAPEGSPRLLRGRHGPACHRAGERRRYRAAGAPASGAPRRPDRPVGFLDRDMAFHREIAAISGNPIYAAVAQAMFDWLAVYHVSLLRAPGPSRSRSTSTNASSTASPSATPRKRRPPCPTI